MSIECRFTMTGDVTVGQLKDIVKLNHRADLLDLWCVEKQLFDTLTMSEVWVIFHNRAGIPLIPVG